jgi:hypothetical protein
MQDVADLNNKIFSHPSLIDSFINENSLQFNDKEIEILKNWKELFIKDEFFVFSVGEKIIFLKSKDEKAYEVLGITDEINDIIPFEPYMTNAVLLPFKGKIIYSGFLGGYNVSFGEGMKKTLTEDFLKAKRKYGIISSLEQPTTEKEESYEELLKFYLKNEKGRFNYEKDIEDILQKNPEMVRIYNQEIGKKNARKIRKKFSDLGINSGWFAIFNDVVVASGKSEKEVLERVEEIIPEDKKDCLFIFKYEKRNKK